MLILGIETSCDETAAAVVRDGTEILSNVVASQIDIHRKFGGVVPELASRAHIRALPQVVEEALREAKASFQDLGALAVTAGPGLVGALLVGVEMAKSISYALKLPLVAVNHLEAHIYANFLSLPAPRQEPTALSPPFMSLVVSGGHTSLIYVKDFDAYELMGRTEDDAAGEAFDKAAKILGLGYPGGPEIDRLSRKGNPQAVDFPRAYMGEDSLDFSFSGIKTALLYYWMRKGRCWSRKGFSEESIGIPSEEGKERAPVADVAASFQAAIVEVLVEKLIKAAKTIDLKDLLIAGGVAVNSYLRAYLVKRAEEEGMRAYFPPPQLCTDNAVMIAGLGFVKLQCGKRASPSLNVDPNLEVGKG